MRYYERLKNLREDNEMTQAEVAAILKTTQSYYAQYESGKRSLPFDRAIILAQFFNISLDYIAGLINYPERLERDGKKTR